MTRLSAIRHTLRAVALCLLVTSSASPAVAGDSLVGEVIAVEAADLVTLDYGTGTYEVRLSGVELDKDPTVSRRATEEMANLLLGKKVRLRFDGRAPDGTMYGRIWLFDPDRIDAPARDAGVLLVRMGLARGFDDGYKYNEMSRAQEEARQAGRGLWEPGRPR